MDKAQTIVIAPWGGFANHVRWLILLDPKFEFSVARLGQESYEALKGPDWPSYQKYVENDIQDSSPSVIREIEEQGGHFHFRNMEQKLETIRNWVYPETRTWHNWLGYEFTFRNALAGHVGMDHYLKKDIAYEKNVLLSVDPDLAYKCYFKFNSLINQLSIEEFKNKVEKSNDKFYNISDGQSYKVFSSDDLFQPVLDQDFYHELTGWLGLADSYQQANIIHGLWFALHKKAEQEFVEHTLSLYENTIS